MKKILLTPILALLIMAGSALKAQDRGDNKLGLPGDNLNLYAVMNLFQESKTLEEFEKKLNEEDTRINNLDLNNDGYVDYITVTDHVNGNVHTIVMQVPLGPNDKQDVGVFTVERLNDGSVQIQLVGDEDLYGRNYVIEPIYDETANPGYTGSRDNVQVVRTTYVQVASWPVIRFIYDPFYIGWHSSWYWGYYPTYWHPWSPCFYDYYYGYHYNWFPVYYSHFRHWDHVRYAGYHDYYYNRVRSYSPTVVVNINKGNYRQTYSRPESRRDGEALYTRLHSERSSNNSRREASVNNSSSRRTESGNTVNRSSNSRSTREAVSTSRPSREAVSTGSSRSTGNVSRSSRETVSSPRSSRSTGNASRPPVNTSSRSSRDNTSMSGSNGNGSRSYSSPSQSRSQVSRPSASVQRSAPSNESRSIARSSSAPSRNYEARSSSAPSRNYQARSSSPAPSRSSGSVSRSSAPRQSSASVRSSGSRSSSGSSRNSGSSGSSDNSRSRR